MTQTQTQTKTPERELSKALRDTLKHARKGKTATEIAKVRKVTPNAVYGAFRTLTEKGYGDELGNGRANGSDSKPAARTPARTPERSEATEVASGVEQALTAVASQREALTKTVENLTVEADDHETRAKALRATAEARVEEIRTLTKMEEVAKR